MWEAVRWTCTHSNRQQFLVEKTGKNSELQDIGVPLYFSGVENKAEGWWEINSKTWGAPHMVGSRWTDRSSYSELAWWPWA